MYWFVVWSFVAVFSYNYDAADANACITRDAIDRLKVELKGHIDNEISIIKADDGDCYNYGQSQQYTGTQSTTVGGRTCQQWNTDFPHRRVQKFIPKTFSDRNSNYCRDTSDHGALWCYTTDPDVRWENCPVPVCQKFKNRKTIYRKMNRKQKLCYSFEILVIQIIDSNFTSFYDILSSYF